MGKLHLWYGILLFNMKCLFNKIRFGLDKNSRLLLGYMHIIRAILLYYLFFIMYFFNLIPMLKIISSKNVDVIKSHSSLTSNT